VDQGRLVPDVVRAFLEVLGELRPHELLELGVVLHVHAVPELRLPVVQVVDRVQIHVFLVPPEHRLPRPDVYVRRIHSLNLLPSQAVLQN
jgi:hypothetical protein